MIPIFHVIVEGPKGCLLLSGSEVFLRLLVEELCGPPNLPSPMANGYTHTECYYIHGASDLDQKMSENAFPPNSFSPTPKIAIKTPFWRTFQCKTYR